MRLLVINVVELQFNSVEHSRVDVEGTDCKVVNLLLQRFSLEAVGAVDGWSQCTPVRLQMNRNMRTIIQYVNPVLSIPVYPEPLHARLTDAAVPTADARSVAQTHQVVVTLHVRKLAERSCNTRINSQ